MVRKIHKETVCVYELYSSMLLRLTCEGYKSELYQTERSKEMNSIFLNVEVGWVLRR